MQLDRTRIAVRERGLLETLDLSLHVMCGLAGEPQGIFADSAGPGGTEHSPLSRGKLWLMLALGIVPMMLLNHLLLGWMLWPVEFGYMSDDDVWQVIRFIWSQSLLIYIEAPLATMFATAFIGRSVFLERPSLKEVIVDVLKQSGRIAWTHLLLRGAAIAWLLLLLDYNNHQPTAILLEFLLFCVAAGVDLLRTLRPFINEIVLLEKNPLRSSSPRTMTIGRRSKALHGPSSGDLILRGMLSSLLAVLLFLSIFGAMRFVGGALLGDWQHGLFPETWGGHSLMLELFLPLAMWLTVGFFAVFRFLSYLDLRIRQEGWEVELKLRAEANRLMSRLS